MLFKPELQKKIEAGIKTQTRRPVKAGDEAIFDILRIRDDILEPISVYRNGRQLWRVGRDYAICPGRGKPQVGRFHLLKIRREDVRCISHADALAEGLFDELNFLAIWTSFYDQTEYGRYVRIRQNTSDAARIASAQRLWMNQLQNRPDHLYDGWVLDFEYLGANDG